MQLLLAWQDHRFSKTATEIESERGRRLTEALSTVVHDYYPTALSLNGRLLPLSLPLAAILRKPQWDYCGLLAPIWPGQNGKALARG